MPLGFDFPGTVKERIEQGWPDSLAVSIALESFRANVGLVESLMTMLRMQEPLTGGILVVAAVGDDSQRSAKGDFVVSAGLPLAADAIISVAALDPDPAGTGYRVSNSSNSGATISAPGRNILSAAVGGGLIGASGTGSACAHVAGVAALWWESLRQEDLPTNASALRARLVTNASGRGFAADVSDAERGTGRVCAPQESSAEASSRCEWWQFRHAGLPSALAGKLH
jgi:subtilisin family serine protease